MDPSYLDYLDIARRRQAIPSALFDEPDHVMTVTDDVLVVPVSDLHIGSPGTDYDRMLQDIEQLMAAKLLLGDRLVIVGLGDYIDGYLSQGTPTNFDQVLSPAEQRHAAEDVLRKLSPSFVIEGDHDLWHSKQEIQHSWVHELCRDEGFQYAQWGGTMTFLTPAGPVRGLVRHRYKGAVAADHLRPHKNLHLDLGPADFTMLGHWHSYPGVHRTFSKRRNEGTYLAVQVGSYKHRDEYGKKLADYYGEYGVPALRIDTGGQVTGYDHYQQGLDGML